MQNFRLCVKGYKRPSPWREKPRAKEGAEEFFRKVAERERGREGLAPTSRLKDEGTPAQFSDKESTLRGGTGAGGEELAPISEGNVRRKKKETQTRY